MLYGPENARLTHSGSPTLIVLLGWLEDQQRPRMGAWLT